VRFKCPRCRGLMETSTGPGDTVDCPRCGEHVLVPAAALPADPHPLHVRGWLLWLLLALLIGSYVVWAVTRN